MSGLARDPPAHFAELKDQLCDPLRVASTSGDRRRRKIGVYIPRHTPHIAHIIVLWTYSTMDLL